MDQNFQFLQKFTEKIRLRGREGIHRRAVFFNCAAKILRCAVFFNCAANIHRRAKFFHTRNKPSPARAKIHGGAQIFITIFLILLPAA